ncbi:MAG: GTP cyclohydrolase, FolE2/MptA family [Burkholderiales bacterium]
MNAPERLFLPDIQSIADDRNLAIDQVGVKGIRHPLHVRTAGGGLQPTVASINMYVALPAQVKGTHMSRFLEVLQAHGHTLDYDALRRLVEATCERLYATRGIVEIEMPYFVAKKAPVSAVPSLLDVDSRIAAYAVESENFESIHNHSAFARLTSRRYTPV